MTKAQQEDLFIEWALYGPREQKKMIDQYLSISEGNCSKDRFFDFLKDKLQIEGYWEKVGLAQLHSRQGGSYATTITERRPSGEMRQCAKRERSEIITAFLSEYGEHASWEDWCAFYTSTR